MATDIILNWEKGENSENGGHALAFLHKFIRFLTLDPNLFFLRSKMAYYVSGLFSCNKVTDRVDEYKGSKLTWSFSSETCLNSSSLISRVALISVYFTDMASSFD